MHTYITAVHETETNTIAGESPLEESYHIKTLTVGCAKGETAVIGQLL